MSRNAIQRIEAHPSFLSAKTVLLYSSLADEVDTKPLISKYAAKKTILLPTVVGDDLELHVYHYCGRWHHDESYIRLSAHD